MLIKATVRVVLIHHIHIAALRSIRQEYIDMVSVNSLSAADIAVGIVHLLLPLLAACIHATAYAALRLLDCHFIAVYLNMTLAIITGCFLSLGRLGIHLRFSTLYRIRNTSGTKFIIRLIKQAALNTALVSTEQ